MGVGTLMIIGDKDGKRVVELDNYLPFLPVINDKQGLIHMSKLWNVTDLDSDLDIAETKYYSITTGAIAVHFQAFLKASTAIKVKFIENCSISGGVALVNKNRVVSASGDSCGVVIKKDVTLETSGDHIDYSVGLSSAHASVPAGDTEWILDPNKTFVLGVNSVADDNVLATNFIFYEQAIVG